MFGLSSKYIGLDQAVLQTGIENPRLTEISLRAVLSRPRINLYVHFDQPLKADELAKYREFVLRRGRQEPLAYILGEKSLHELYALSNTCCTGTATGNRALSRKNPD